MKERVISAADGGGPVGGPVTPGGEPDFYSVQIAQARRFHAEPAHPPGRLAVIGAGREHCRPDYHISRGTFASYAVEFVARGEGTLRLGGQVYKLQPGDVFAYGPGVSQDIRCDPARPLVKYFLDFSGTAAAALLKAPAPAPGRLVQSSAPDDLPRLFDDVIAAGFRRTPFSGRICAVAAEQLLLRIAETAVSAGTIGTPAFATYQRCRRTIEQEYLRMDGLKELGRMCDVDPAYICRLFARFDHESPYQYLIRLKMLDAAQRLQEPGVLVKQVAAEMGFGDAFGFSRTFRQVLGVSPRRFVQLRGLEG